MIWRDTYGTPIRAGDIVEDTERRMIGKVIMKYGRPHMRVWKKFSAQTMDYDPVELVGPEEAYIRDLAPKKPWRYKLNGHRLDSVEVLLARKDRDWSAKTMEPIAMPKWEAPAPIDWTQYA